MRRKGFTLIELLVVIAIIALLASILMPTLRKAQELANRAKCIGHLNGIGKGMKMYSSSYDNQMPWLGVAATNDWFSPTGTSRTVAPTSTSADRAVTALPWLMVRTSSVDVKMFVCPSDKLAVEETDLRNTTTNVYHWDFTGLTGGKYTTSYSWAAPVTSGTAVVNGVDEGADSGSVVMADKTPSALSGTSLNTTADMTGWNSATLTGANLQKYNSQNHSSGEVTQFLTMNYSAGSKSRPDCGQASDFIFGASDVDTGGAQNGKTETIAAHKTACDAFVIGPK